jgi:hypothetical protein
MSDPTQELTFPAFALLECPVVPVRVRSHSSLPIDLLPALLARLHPRSRRSSRDLGLVRPFVEFEEVRTRFFPFSRNDARAKPEAHASLPTFPSLSPLLHRGRVCSPRALDGYLMQVCLSSFFLSSLAPRLTCRPWRPSEHRFAASSSVLPSSWLQTTFSSVSSSTSLALSTRGSVRPSLPLHLSSLHFSPLRSHSLTHADPPTINVCAAPKWYTIVFCTGDIISLVIQAIGGGGAAIAVQSNPPRDPDKGARIMVGGIVFQMVIMVLFTAIGTECKHFSPPFRPSCITSCPIVAPSRSSSRRFGPIADYSIVRQPLL